MTKEFTFSERDTLFARRYDKGAARLTAEEFKAGLEEIEAKEAKENTGVIKFESTLCKVRSYFLSKKAEKSKQEVSIDNRQRPPKLTL